jgi:hypothetical protein
MLVFGSCAEISVHQQCWDQCASVVLRSVCISGAEISVHQWCWNQCASVVLRSMCTSGAETSVHQWCWDQCASVVLRSVCISGAEISVHLWCWDKCARFQPASSYVLEDCSLELSGAEKNVSKIPTFLEVLQVIGTFLWTSLCHTGNVMS